MDTPLDVFTLCDHFVHDIADSLSPDMLRKLRGWVRSRSIERLAELPASLSSPDVDIQDETYHRLRQIGALFKKNELFSNSDCRAKALSAFYDAEVRCKITNKRLDHYYVHRDRIDPDVALVLDKAERIIHSVLGDYGSFLGKIPELVKVTPGATSTHSRRDSVPYMKFRRELNCSARAQPFLKALYTHFGYKCPKLRITTTNRVTFVPKNYKTERTIACEPDGHLPFQLAFDRHVKGRLKRKLKIDLSSQVRNQELAKKGSITNLHSTIDLSAASDTIAYNTVAWFFPDTWWKFVTAFRSPQYIIADQRGKYHKFSSMGNGMTFGIETLIFGAVVKACGSEEYAVYGDDIVIETALVPLLLRVFRFLGFKVNQDKSFTDGPFRESCGTDYVSGRLVTPIYLRGAYRTKPAQCHVINSLIGVSDPYGSVWGHLRNLASTLPVGPWDPENTSCYVHVDVPSSYDQGSIRFADGTLKVRAYVSKLKEATVENSQTLALWHLSAKVGPVSYSSLLPYFQRATYATDLAQGRETLQKVPVTNVTSKVPSPTTRYRYRLKSWFPPARVPPTHVYSWADFLLSK